MRLEHRSRTARSTRVEIDHKGQLGTLHGIGRNKILSSQEPQLLSVRDKDPKLLTCSVVDWIQRTDSSMAATHPNASPAPGPIGQES